jgi:hypothetical protein
MLRSVLFPALFLLVAGPAVATGPGAPAPAPEAPPSWEKASAMAQHLTIHVPRMTITTSTTIITRAPVRPPAYREKKGDDCVKLKKVIGYSVSTANSVDLVMDDGDRVRAKLGSDCPALGFYSGFYLKPNPDGKMCVRRDVLRGRSGTACSIDEFAKLIPIR